MVSSSRDGWYCVTRRASGRSKKFGRPFPGTLPGVKMSARIIGTLLVVALFAGTTQVHHAEEKAKPERKNKVNVAILLFEGVELLDFAGPAEVFGVAGEGKS